MRAVNFHSIFSFHFRLWNLSFLCCFFVFFLFRNDFAYLIEQVIEPSHLSLKHNLWYDDISSEIEIEKQEVILYEVFTEHLNASFFEEEQLIKNPITSHGNALCVYLEVLSPPPWRSA